MEVLWVEESRLYLWWRLSSHNSLLISPRADRTLWVRDEVWDGRPALVFKGRSRVLARPMKSLSLTCCVVLEEWAQNRLVEQYRTLVWNIVRDYYCDINPQYTTCIFCCERYATIYVVCYYGLWAWFLTWLGIRNTLNEGVPRVGYFLLPSFRFPLYTIFVFRQAPYEDCRRSKYEKSSNWIVVVPFLYIILET